MFFLLPKNRSRANCGCTVDWSNLEQTICIRSLLVASLLKNCACMVDWCPSCESHEPMFILLFAYAKEVFLYDKANVMILKHKRLGHKKVFEMT